MIGRFQRYIQSHWRGKHSWALVLFVNLFLVRAVLSVLTEAMASMTGILIIVIIVGLNSVVFFWQAVGTKRSADSYLRQSSDMYSTLMVYAGLGIVALLTVLQFVDLISTRFAQEPKPLVINIPKLEIVDEGRTVLAVGEINYGLYTALGNALVANPGITMVLLQSDGGSIFAGRAIAKTILDANLASRVEGHCFSACTLAFAAGHKRTIGPNAQLGFHGYAFDSAMRVQTVNVSEEEAKDRAFFLERGISREFVKQVFKTPPDQLWVPTIAEVQKAGVTKE